MNAYNDEELLRKGVYPYEYMDCMANFNQTNLHDASEFYSSLTGNGGKSIIARIYGTIMIYIYP
jgi:hypothetical protein